MKVSKRAQSVPPSATMAVDTKAKELKAKGVDIVGFGAGFAGGGGSRGSAGGAERRRVDTGLPALSLRKRSVPDSQADSALLKACGPTSGHLSKSREERSW